jgi:hypothetical protein
MRDTMRSDTSWGRRLAALTLATMLASGVTGCKLDSEKDDAADTGDGGSITNPPPTGTANRAPSISGTPVSTAKVSLPYSFQPTASDPDGDRLTFQIVSKPDWATFDPASGRLEGTPPAGSNGTFTGVQITVTDGHATNQLAAFSITVVDPAVGSAELAWQPPTLNEDGTPLADLSGYVIRYGKTAGALDQSVRITNPGTTMYVIDELIEGTWYFSLASVNTSGVESRPTGYVSKTIS